jgi:ParB-like chromosome segregation protein Spo0J
MSTQTLELDQLRSHPANSNVMPEHLVAKLADHIERSGRYPPLIVRPIDDDTSAGDTPASPVYQILDGHHRALALRRLGHTRADCVVWRADDREALVLLATLNRLQGQDDPHKRAALVGALADKHDLPRLAELLPERREQIKKLLEINDRPPSPRAPQPIGQMPVAVHFFLLPAQKKRLDRALAALGGAREEALMRLLDQDPVPAGHTDPD